MEQRAKGHSTLKDLMDAYERTLIAEALAATGGNQRQAALRLGVLATTLHEKMKRLGMVAPTGSSLRQEPSTRRPDSTETAPI